MVHEGDIQNGLVFDFKPNQFLCTLLCIPESIWNGLAAEFDPIGHFKCRVQEEF